MESPENMSRKSKRNRPEPMSAPGTNEPTAIAHRQSRRGLIAGLIVFVLVAALAVLALRKYGAPAEGARPGADALASEHSPSLGDAAAKVHVVEFLDPACETCAQFYPVVKQMMIENPGRIRLSVRHVAFHDGADYVVRLLEASRAQDGYWQTLQVLLQTQAHWAPHHTVRADLVDPIVAASGLDMTRLASDMNSPEVAERIARDRADAMALKVTATPEFFVNGRTLPEFGYEPLRALVREELERSN
jgi:protein-disulfide isomerase